MQRVRIGLTGLAAVFVVVLLAAVFTSPSDETPITANSIEQQLANGAAAVNTSEADEPKEPLAELGVAPGAAASSSDTETATPPASAPASPAQATPDQ